MVLIPLELTHSVLDIISFIVGAAGVIVGWLIVREVEGEGDLKNSMILATFATFFFTLTQVADFLGEEFYGGSDVSHIVNRILFLIAMVFIFSAGHVILRFFKGISFKR